ncbi:ABC transporter permease [Patescibacteria group bacterium]|nr:ABC transporter permease [Patescibacteria group bacterium]MBU1963227.1 ABC transporter permease [Patescibacteria group bacterium]
MMKVISTIYIIWRREIIRYWRDKARIVSSLIQPVMFLIIFGAGFQQTLASSDLPVDYIQFMYPGIIAMGIMGVAMFSTISTVWDREFGFLKEILVAPVGRSSIALGKTIGATTIATLQAVILLLISPLIGVTLTFTGYIQIIFLMVLLGMALSGLGLFIASLMKTTESFGLLMQLLIFPMFFVSGAFFPLTNVPDWLGWIARINPLTYGVDAFRQVMLHGQIDQSLLDSISLYPIYVDVMFLFGFLIVMILLAVLAFNKRN